jgi:hypothetical protein
VVNRPRATVRVVEAVALTDCVGTSTKQDLFAP